MRNYDEFFIGYKVPEKIKRTAIAIMKRFTINGLCDGLYISNIIAYTSGGGDGQGHFSNDNISNIETIASRLQSAYSCNIFKKDIREFETILELGKLNKKQALNGISEYIAVCQSEKNTCDEWRKEYLNKCINRAKETIKDLESVTDKMKN